MTYFFTMGYGIAFSLSLSLGTLRACCFRPWKSCLVQSANPGTRFHEPSALCAAWRRLPGPGSEPNKLGFQPIIWGMGDIFDRLNF
uniref:Uncharacterized protein n=1 Tax=Setaria viridis TaxID=4556 RepID=A0A4U6TVR7_SETVI|nr:hypothetical protein SEVIR_7G196033v2 [Setaria viridis]